MESHKTAHLPVVSKLTTIFKKFCAAVSGEVCLQTVHYFIQNMAKILVSKWFYMGKIWYKKLLILRTFTKCDNFLQRFSKFCVAFFRIVALTTGSLLYWINGKISIIERENTPKLIFILQKKYNKGNLT